MFNDLADKFSLNMVSLTKIKDYVNMLQVYSKKLSLVSYKTEDELISRHAGDSLELLHYIKDYDEIIDFGTGAGLPGILLAIVAPEKKFYLVDSRRKRISFLELVKLELGLKNVSLYTSRIENLNLELNNACIVSRAVANINTIIDLTKHFNSPWFLLKGSLDSIKDEINTANKNNKRFIDKVVRYAKNKHVVTIDSLQC